MFNLLFGKYSKEELKFIEDVFQEVKKRSKGRVHITFDYDKLVESYYKGETPTSIVNECFMKF